jgi:hypothetical protein
MSMKQVSNAILWLLVAIYAIVSLISPLHYMLVFIAFVFSLLHGAKRYRWSGILAFLISCVAVSNILEISSIRGLPTVGTESRNRTVTQKGYLTSLFTENSLRQIF